MQGTASVEVACNQERNVHEQHMREALRQVGAAVITLA